MGEKRVSSRLSYEIDVELALDDNEPQSGHIHNISTGGAYITTLPQPPFGSRVKIFIELPGVGDKCEIVCIVRWTKKGRGVGLQFERLRPIEVWSLNKLIKSLERE
ncbi:MAG: hypothetical protein GY854_33200 [Deltaproteobacteria bacterium]|nr:hypothetical protein [Deltaproteobacteria bacterium]